MIELDNATVLGGTLGAPAANLLSLCLASQGTVIETVGRSVSNILDGTASPLNNDALVLVCDNSSLTLKGAIVNGSTVTRVRQSSHQLANLW